MSRCTSIDEQCLTRERFEALSFAQRELDNLVDFVKSILRPYGDGQGVDVLDMVATPDHGAFLGHLLAAMILQNDSVSEHCVQMFDELPLAAACQHTLIATAPLINIIKTRWLDTFEQLKMQVHQATPDWRPQASNLMEDAMPAITREVIACKAFQQLADCSVMFASFHAASRVVQGAPLVFDAPVVSNFRDMASYCTTTTSLIYALYHLRIAVPKLVGLKNKKNAGQALHAQLVEKGSFANMPECVQAAIQELMELK